MGNFGHESLYSILLCLTVFPADMDSEAYRCCANRQCPIKDEQAWILCNLELVNWKQIWSNPPWDGAAWCKRMPYGHVITRQHRLLCLWVILLQFSFRASEMSVQKECCGFFFQGTQLVFCIVTWYISCLFLIQTSYTRAWWVLLSSLSSWRRKINISRG